MKAIQVILAACLMCIGLSAAEVSGEWTAEVQGRHGGSMKITMKLKAEDGLVTGTVRDPRGEAPISEGVLDGDNLSFSVVTEMAGYQVTEQYRGTVEDDMIHFSLKVESGRSKAAPVRDFEAKRVN